MVMKYVPDKTAAQCFQDSVDDDKRKDSIYTRMAFALSELHRTWVAPNSRPAAVNGGRIRHERFDDNQASLHYQDVDELEQHINSVRRKRHDYWWLTRKLILLCIQFLFLTKSHCRVKDLAQEPMIFCYYDIWLDNFIIDEEDEDHITIVVSKMPVSCPPASRNLYLPEHGTRYIETSETWLSYPVLKEWITWRL